MDEWMVIIDAIITTKGNRKEQVMHRFVCGCYVIYEIEHSRICLVGVVGYRQMRNRKKKENRKRDRQIEKTEEIKERD